jgi:superfamily II DNA helicase RecQ
MEQIENDKLLRKRESMNKARAIRDEKRKQAKEEREYMRLLELQRKKEEQLKNIIPEKKAPKPIDKTKSFYSIESDSSESEEEELILNIPKKSKSRKNTNEIRQLREELEKLKTQKQEVQQTAPKQIAPVQSAPTPTPANSLDNEYLKQLLKYKILSS